MEADDTGIAVFDSRNLNGWMIPRCMKPKSRQVIPESWFVTPESRRLIPESWFVIPESLCAIPESRFVTPESWVWSYTPGGWSVCRNIRQRCHIDVRSTSQIHVCYGRLKCCYDLYGNSTKSYQVWDGRNVRCCRIRHQCDCFAFRGYVMFGIS